MTTKSELEKENFALAANQCHHGTGDEYGNHSCSYREVLKELYDTASFVSLWGSSSVGWRKFYDAKRKAEKLLRS